MEPSITLYALQHCAHCKRAKQYLENRNLRFKTVSVDMLSGAERNDTLRHLRRINPGASFPTLVIGDTVVIGFQKEKIEEALTRQSG